MTSDDNPNKELLEKINKRFFHIENAYIVRRELYLHFNKAVSPEASIKYLEIINSYRGFFVPLLESALSYALIGLNALISSNDKQSLQKLINKIQTDGLADFRTELKTLRTKHEKTLSSIADLRMEYFAHLGDIDLDEVEPVSDDDYIKLFEDTKTLVNKINNEYGRTVWYMDGDANETIKHTHELMNNLMRGEAQRLGEIDVEYISTVFKDGREKWLKDAD